MNLMEFASKHFVQIQLLMLVAGIYVAFRLLQDNSGKSKFRVREADRTDLNRPSFGAELADAKLKKQAPPPKPLELPGIRLHGEPHEILGVVANASEAEVLKAYKDAIKRFHPDRIQGQAQEQIQFYQQASAKLNDAKEMMLKQIRSR